MSKCLNCSKGISCLEEIEMEDAWKKYQQRGMFINMICPKCNGKSKKGDCNCEKARFCYPLELCDDGFIHNCQEQIEDAWQKYQQRGMRLNLACPKCSGRLKKDDHNCEKERFLLSLKI